MSYNNHASNNGSATLPIGNDYVEIPKIKTQVIRRGDGEVSTAVCVDDSGPTVKATTLDELHSLQKKKSAPNTPKSGQNLLSDEERQQQQLQSIR